MKALLDGDLSSSRGIEQCSQAAIRLQHCTAAEIHPCMYPSSSFSDNARWWVFRYDMKIY